MDHRTLLSLTIVLVLLMQLQAHLAPSRERPSVHGWRDRHAHQQPDPHRLAVDLATLAALR
ncbi:MAG: hypothetical protein AB7O95_22990 [Geminicoccaceae bacterium]